jgi:hypothetical protein
VVAAILRDATGARRYDAGRIIPSGALERFVVGGAFVRGPYALVVRTDDPEARAIRVTVGSAAPIEVRLSPSSSGRWSETRVPLDDVGPGDDVTVLAEDGALRSFAYAIE